MGLFPESLNLSEFDGHTRKELFAGIESLRHQHERDVATLKYWNGAITQLQDEIALRERLAKILTETAIAIKGEEAPLTRHSWHDLAQCATDAVKEHNALCQQLSSSLHDLYLIKEAGI